MNKIPFAVGEASNVAVMPINADKTTGSTSGGSSVFAGLVISRSGKPNTVLHVDSNNFKSVLGEPFRAQEGLHFEPMRHIAMAVNGGTGYVVRIAAPDMMIPAIHLTSKTTAAKDNGGKDGAAGKESAVGATTVKVSTSATAFGADIALPDDGVLSIYIDDGDKSTSRTLSLEPLADNKPGFYSLKLKVTDTMGSVTTLESYEVSLNPNAISDSSQSAYLPTVLEVNESRLRAIHALDATLPDSFVGFVEQPFVGGSDGDVTKIAAKHYDAAISALENSLVEYTAILTLGIYDEAVIGKLAKLAKEVRVDAFGDIDPRLSAASALEKMSSLGLSDNENITLYYFPYSCRDPLSQAKTVVFGLSGDAFVAKAKGVALVPDVGGWHYSPAGVSRGSLSRQNIKPLASAGSINRELFAKAHLNVVASIKGAIVIDDALTACTQNNQKKFQHVVSVLNSIARNYYALAMELKHSPDGITRDGLEKGLPRLLDRYVAAEALVKPSDAENGEAPYIVTVKKTDFDAWQIRWEVCVTGVARRLIGEPVLLR